MGAFLRILFHVLQTIVRIEFNIYWGAISFCRRDAPLLPEIPARGLRINDFPLKFVKLGALCGGAST